MKNRDLRMRRRDSSVSARALCAAATCFTGAALAGIAPPPPPPHAGTTFDLFVGDQYTYDSNLYRVPANFGPVASLASPKATRGDQINALSAGGTGQLIAGRQDVDVTVRLDDNRFLHNTELNHVGGDAQAVWNWQVGPYFSGTLGGEFNRALAGFAEERYIGRDIVNNTSYYGSGRYQVGPHWAIVGGARDAHTEHGVSIERLNNFRADSGSAGVEYVTGINDTFTTEYVYTNGMYPQDSVFDGVPYNRNFKEDIYRERVVYSLTDKLKFSGYAGYIKHAVTKENLLPSTIFGDFSGDIFRANVTWQTTEKTQLVAATWHELHAFLANASDYFVSKGGSLAPTWLPTEKITVALVGSLENQNYIAIQTTQGLDAPGRHDRVVGEQLNIFYLPTPRWTINFFVRHENRNSTDPGYSYVDTIANVAATYRFF